MKGALILSVAAFAATKQAAGTAIIAGVPQCTCTAQCIAYGDPHMEDFEGVKWTEAGPNFVFYTLDDFQVTGVAGTQKRIASVTFGDKTYVANDVCDTPGLTFYEEQDFGTKGILSMEIMCRLKNGEKLFNFYLNKTDVGSAADFKSMESSINSNGLCPNGPSSRRVLRGASDNINTQSSSIPTSCTCESICQAIGDPEVYDFYGNYRRVTTSQKLPIYSLDDFTIAAQVEDKRMKTVYFGDDTYDAASLCTKVGQTFDMEKTWGTGSRVAVELSCQKKSGSNGFFFNLMLSKSDVATNNQNLDFRSIEASSQSSGICQNIDQ